MRCERCETPIAHTRRRCRDCADERAAVGARVAGALAGVDGVLTASLGLVLAGSGTALLLLAPLVVGLGLAQVGVARRLWNAEYWAWAWGVTLHLLATLVVLGVGLLTVGTAGAVVAAAVAGLTAAYIYGHHGEFTAGDGPAGIGR
jgi:hypothetical protein